jgi:hypothetical protein
MKILLSPLELQTGWAGAYLYEWFFSRGFSAITGRDYATPGTDLEAFMNITKGMTVAAVEGDSFGLLLEYYASIPALVANVVSPYERAISSIQFLGIAMRNKGGVFHFPLPCAGSVPLPIKDGWAKRFNYTMLLHVFQLGMAQPTPADEADHIAREMAKLIKGVIGSSPTKTDLSLPQFAKTPYYGAISFVLAVIGIPIPAEIVCQLPDRLQPCDCEPDVEVGAQGAETDRNDLYSAAIGG